MKKNKKVISLIAIVMPFLGYSAVSQAEDLPQLPKPPQYAPLPDGIYNSQIEGLPLEDGKAIIVNQKLYVINKLFKKNENRIVLKINSRLSVIPINQEGVDVINGINFAYSGDNNLGYTGNFTGEIGTQNRVPAYLQDVIYTQSTRQSARDTIKAKVFYPGEKKDDTKVVANLALKYNPGETEISATAEALAGEYGLDISEGPRLSLTINKQGQINPGSTLFLEGENREVPPNLKQYEFLVKSLGGLKTIKPVDQSKGAKNIYIIKSTENNEDIAGVATIKNENGRKNLEIVYLNNAGYYSVIKLSKKSNYSPG